MRDRDEERDNWQAIDPRLYRIYKPAHEGETRPEKGKLSRYVNSGPP